MKPVFFEIPRLFFLIGTAVVAAVLFWIERKEPLKAKLITAAAVAGAFVIEFLFIKGPVEVPAYGFMIMVAFITGTYFAAYRAKKWGVDPNNVIDGGLLAVVFGILGARLLFTIQYFDIHFWGTGYRNGEPYNKFWNVFKLWQGGLVFYGGLIGAAAAIIILFRKRKLKLPFAADLCLPSVILGLAITRIGCFFNGCCFGRITDVPWKVTFPEGSYSHLRQLELIKMFIADHSAMFDNAYFSGKMEALKSIISLDPAGIRSHRALMILAEMKQKIIDSGFALDDLSCHMHTLLSTPFGDFPCPVHPTQIYASIMGFVLFGLILFLTRYRKFDGQMGTLLCILYAVNRFTIECFRSDNNTNLGLTISQWISIALFIGCGYLYYLLKKKGELTPIPVPAEESPERGVRSSEE